MYVRFQKSVSKHSRYNWPQDSVLLAALTENHRSSILIILVSVIQLEGQKNKYIWWTKIQVRLQLWVPSIKHMLLGETFCSFEPRGEHPVKTEILFIGCHSPILQQSSETDISSKTISMS